MHKNPYCKTISPLLSGYVSRTLNEQETDLVKEHLSTCTVCQGIVDGIKRYMKETNPLAFKQGSMGKGG